MTTIELSELGPAAEHVKRGETVEVVDEGRVVATVVPSGESRLEARIKELEAQGRVRWLGSGKPIPPEFFTEELPPYDGESIVDELIRARDED